MPTQIKIGEQIKEVDILNLLPPDEGSINQWYGRIGSGKTYAATADILSDLRVGKIVYANWRINWEGYDQRSNPFNWLLRFFFLKKTFFYFPKENFHYLPIDGEFMRTFERLTDCNVYLDEGHLAFDSYQMAKMSIQDRASVLHTRHFNRTINIISQRPTAIHVTLRANVNRFFKCERIFHIPFTNIMRFRKTEFQDLTSNESVDEENPIEKKGYWASKRIFKAYDSKYIRGDMATSQQNYAIAYHIKWTDIFRKKHG